MSWSCWIYLPVSGDIEDKGRGELGLDNLFIWIKSIWLLELQGKLRDLASQCKPYFCNFLNYLSFILFRIGDRKQSTFLWLCSTFLEKVDLQTRIFCFKIYFMLSLSTFGWSVQFAAVRNVVLNSDVVFQLEGENPDFWGGRRRGLD